jgi:hypothetical protein
MSHFHSSDGTSTDRHRSAAAIRRFDRMPASHDPSGFSLFVRRGTDASISTAALQTVEDADASIRLLLPGRFQMQIPADSTGVAFLPTHRPAAPLCSRPG